MNFMNYTLFKDWFCKPYYQNDYVDTDMVTQENTLPEIEVTPTSVTTISEKPL